MPTLEAVFNEERPSRGEAAMKVFAVRGERGAVDGLVPLVSDSDLIEHLPARPMAMGTDVVPTLPGCAKFCLTKPVAAGLGLR